MLAYVLDDDPAQLLLATRLLARLGWEVRGASDCAAFRRLCAQREPDLALCDVNVGAEDGIALCRDLRAGGAGCRFVIMSGDPENAARACDAGLERFLRKPFALDDLARAVAESARVSRRSRSVLP